jgi:hypothetical protein
MSVCRQGENKYFISLGSTIVPWVRRWSPPPDLLVHLYGIRCPSVSIAPPTFRSPSPRSIAAQPSRSNNTPHYTESDHGVLYLRRMWRVHEEGQSRCSCGEMSSVLLCELVRMRILHLGEAELTCIITHSSIHDISHCLLSYDSRSQCRVSFPFASSVLAHSAE